MYILRFMVITIRMMAGGVCSQRKVVMAAQLQAVHIRGDVHLSRIPVCTGEMLMPHEERCGTL